MLHYGNAIKYGLQWQLQYHVKELRSLSFSSVSTPFHPLPVGFCSSRPPPLLSGIIKFILINSTYTTQTSPLRTITTHGEIITRCYRKPYLIYLLFLNTRHVCTNPFSISLLQQWDMGREPDSFGFQAHFGCFGFVYGGKQKISHSNTDVLPFVTKPCVL